MSQGFAPFYDVNRTYEDNYLQGPFGAFAEVLRADASDSAGSVTSVVAEVASDSSSEVQGVQTIQAAQAQEFLGFRVNLPFGIPAGPLLNERFTTAAFRMGFDLAVSQDGSFPRMGLQCVPERAGRASAECRWFAGSGQCRT